MRTFSYTGADCMGSIRKTPDMKAETSPKRPKGRPRNTEPTVPYTIKVPPAMHQFLAGKGKSSRAFVRELIAREMAKTR